MRTKSGCVEPHLHMCRFFVARKEGTVMIKRLLITACFFLTLLCGGVFAEDVELAWDANTEPDLSFYMIYRSENSGDHVTGINSPHLVGSSECGAGDTSCAGFWDLGLPYKTTYYWVVTAVDDSLQESGKSNEVTHTTAPQNLPPNSPSGCYIKTVVQ